MSPSRDIGVCVCGVGRKCGFRNGKFVEIDRTFVIYVVTGGGGYQAEKKKNKKNKNNQRNTLLLDVYLSQVW